MKPAENFRVLHSMRFIATLALGIVGTYAATTPSADELLNRVLAAEPAREQMRAHYIYREHTERSHPDGKVDFTVEYEWIYLEGKPYRRLVARNGKPLKGKQAEEEERRFQMTRAERRAADAKRKPDPGILSAGIDLAHIVKLMTHSITGEESINGRPTWVIHSEPAPRNSDAILSKKEQERLCYRTTLWIDKEDFAITQKRWEVTKIGPQVLPGSHSIETYDRIAPGLWMIHVLEGEFYSGPPQPKGHWKQTHRFSDYRKFGSESNVSFDPPSIKLPN